MIDAKSILDQLVRGAGGSGQSSQNSPASGRGDDLASLLRHLLGGGDDPHGHSPSEQGRDPSEPQGRVSPNAPDRGVSFEDVRRSRPSRDQSLPEGPTEPESQGSGQGGGLADILGQFLGQGRSQPGAPGGGNLAEILGQVLGQATGDVKQGAQRLDAATGASSNLKDMLGQLSGRPPRTSSARAPR